MGSRAGWTKAGELLAVSPASRHSSERSECLEEASGDLTTGLSLTLLPPRAFPGHIAESG